MWVKVPADDDPAQIHSTSVQAPPLPHSQAPSPAASVREGIAPVLASVYPLLSAASLSEECSPLPPAAARPCTPPASPRGVPCNMPLHTPSQQRSLTASVLDFVIPLMMAIIDMAVVIVHTHTRQWRVRNRAHLLHKKKSKRGVHGQKIGTSNNAFRRDDSDEETLAHPHEKQLIDLVAWHIEALDAKWYVKPRFTCWFEEYLFNIYTPNMFYDILRMRRRTFDRIVQDLWPFVQGQHTHWRQPIGVEKKVVVTLFKLMHGVSIPLVADKATLGKSTVHGILR
jgi:hypothetical protein